MLIKIIAEIVVLWLIFLLYMWILVGRGKGKMGGIQFYPKEVQKRAVECGLTTEEAIKNQSVFCMVLLLLIDIIVPFVMIYFVNGGRSYWDFAWQWCVLFMGQELCDWFLIDVYWVACTDWWLIPEAQDLEYLWHDPKVKLKGKIKLYIVSPLIALIFGGLCYCISLLMP